MENHYCYIDDVLESCTNDKMLELMNGKKFSSETYDYDLDNKNKLLDPDKKSHQLYDDLARVLSGKIGNRNNELLFIKVPNETEIKDDEGRRYGSDYIGPNCTNAHKDFGYADSEIGKILKETRILGGHMLWIRHTFSINNVKAGEGIYDRIDLTLAEIQEWFKGNDKATYHNGLFKIINGKDKDWFELFKDSDGKNGFKNFIVFFMLTDFVDENYNVISLSCSDFKNDDIVTVKEELDKIDKCGKGKAYSNSFLPGYQFGEVLSNDERKERFEKFVSNNIELIKRRTKQMKKSL